MTYTEEALPPISENTTMTVDRWNAAAASTRYPQYIYNQTTYVDGGNLDAYRRTWAGYDLGSIESYGRRYTEYRDIRSTWMWRDYSIANINSIGSNTWATVTNYTNRSNTYTATNQEGRMTPNLTSGTLVPNVNSVYIFYAELYIASVPAGMTNAFCQIMASSNSRAEVNQNVGLQQGDSVRLRNQCVVAYRNGASIPYTVRFKVIYSPTAAVVTVKFGYTELIGKKSGCGAHTVL